MVRVRRLSILLLVTLLLLLVLAASAFAQQPTRVLLVVMDQMRPEYAEQYDMTNVLWLQENGLHFPNAYVGHMQSDTVVSHNVIASGLFPKHMGWSDEAIRDIDGLLDYGEGAIVETGALGYNDYVKLIEAAGDYPKIGDYLHEKFPGTVVAMIGQKGYQVESMAAANADYWVRMGSRKALLDLPSYISNDPAVLEPMGIDPLPARWRGPSGNVPDYIKTDYRFYISSDVKVGDDYGTASTAPAWMYYEDGRYVPGRLAGRESGDGWVANAATAIMENEDWSGLFLNFSAIDKMGHMWGGGDVDDLLNYTWDPNSNFDWVHLPFAAKNADNALGRLIAKLKELGQFEETLIVVLADHGGQDSERFFGGSNVYDGGNSAGWYAGAWVPGWGTDPMVPNWSDGPPALAPLMATGNVRFSYQSTSIHTYLIDQSWSKKIAAAKVMGTLPGVVATYVKSKDNDSYKVFRAGRTCTPMTSAEKSWWKLHGQELVNTMAFEGSADVVGLLADHTNYSVWGDHGGHQRQVQRVPMVWYNPGICQGVKKAEIRLADVMPTILRTLGIEQTSPTDGKAYKIPIAQ
ncbi:MAG TPA: alkaline phosphatase family protein [Thermoleophilia bacterium]|nr:alkaline phosphatase family protein [Thermoleophilia bacterium]